MKKITTLICLIFLSSCSKETAGEKFIDNINSGNITSVSTEFITSNVVGAKNSKVSGKGFSALRGGTTEVSLVFTTNSGETIPYNGILNFVDYQYDNYREVITFEPIASDNGEEGIEDPLTLVLFYSERYQDDPTKMLINIGEINLMGDSGTYSEQNGVSRYVGPLKRLADSEQFFLTYYWNCVGFGDGVEIPDVTTENLPETGETIDATIEVFDPIHLTDDIADQLKRSIKDRFTGIDYYLDTSNGSKAWDNDSFQIYNFGYEDLYGGTLMVQNYTLNTGPEGGYNNEIEEAYWFINDDFYFEIDGEVYEISLDGDPANCASNTVLTFKGNGEDYSFKMGYPSVPGFGG